jgi:formylglycine-generating enzyme required for sulfatase activity/serine/threonine protein kinase
MGVVYQARHIFLKTPHAIKVILPDLVGNDPMLVTRFRQEALAAAAIRHQNIIAVTDFGILRGTMPFLVMEYVSGKSLHDLLLEEGALPPSRALEIFSAVGAGVAAAHRQGIVHRDLKPLNIMFQEGLPVAEAVKVLDFGLAKIKSGELLGSFVQAKTSGLMGSPFYMAPEQWGDEEPDARADIYSLGVILYQMLGGDVPFKGTSIPSIMKKHLTTAPPSFASLGVTVPPEIEAVVRHALEKEAENRPASVEDFIRELREAVDSLSASLRRTSLGTFNTQSQTISPQGTTSIPPDATTLRIHTNPANSRVYINNVSVGMTDNSGELVVPDMLRGTHRIQVLHDGYAEWSQQVECRGGACDIEAQLQNLMVTSGPLPSIGHQSMGDPYAGTISSGSLLNEPVPQQSQASMEAQRLRQQAEVLEEQARQEEAEAAREREHKRLEQEERERLAREQQAREEETRRKALEEARLEAEAEARRKAEEEATRLRAEEARLKAEEEERRRLEAEEEKRKAEEEAARQKALEEARLKTVEEERLRVEAEARARAEAEAARKRAEDEARQRAEALAAQKRAEEEEAARLSAAEEQRERERVEALERERAAREQKEREEQAARSSIEKVQSQPQPPVNLDATQSQRHGIITQPVDGDSLAEDEQQPFAGQQRQQSAQEDNQALWRSRQPTFDSSLHNVADVVPKKTGFSKALLAAIIGVVLIGGGIGAWLMLRAQSNKGVENNTNAQNQNGGEKQSPTPTPTQTQTPAPTPMPPVTAKAELISIPGGTLEMGRGDGTLPEGPAHLVVIKSFAMDKTEVTNAEYAEFVHEKNHPAPSHWAGDKPAAGSEMLPVVNVSYSDAVEFAKWRSKRDGAAYRLPTEEEWEYAARGGDQGNLYPWGNTWEEGGAGVRDPRVIVPKPVGSYPKDKTRWGLLDMEGNVYEWTSSKASYYPGNTQQVKPETKNWVIIRGASFSTDSELKLPLTFRNWYDPKLKNNLVGFRLVRQGS